jgi:hypothetical protein
LKWICDLVVYYSEILGNRRQTGNDRRLYAMLLPVLIQYEGCLREQDNKKQMKIRVPEKRERNCDGFIMHRMRE